MLGASPNWDFQLLLKNFGRTKNLQFSQNSEGRELQI